MCSGRENWFYRECHSWLQDLVGKGDEVREVVRAKNALLRHREDTKQKMQSNALVQWADPAAKEFRRSRMIGTSDVSDAVLPAQAGVPADFAKETEGEKEMIVEELTAPTDEKTVAGKAE